MIKIRNIEILIKQQVENAKLGEVVDYHNKLRYGTGYLTPYISGSEELEALLYQYEIVPEGVPIELCGVKSASILNNADIIGEKAKSEEGIDYYDLSKRNPLFMSFPPEITWIERDTGINYFGKSLNKFLTSSGNFDEKTKQEIIDKLISRVQRAEQNQNFWYRIHKEMIDNQPLSKILFEWSISMALGMRCKYMSGLNPLVDEKYKTSINFNHKINLAYNSLIEDIEDAGMDSPLFFYTIPLNSTMIKSGDWTKELDDVVKLCKSAIETNSFSGIHVSVRNLNLISNDGGRVEIVNRLFDKLNSIATENKYPIWYSRFGLIGLRALDEGADFVSYTSNLNLRDVILKSGKVQKEYQYSSVVNIDTKEIWSPQKLTNKMIDQNHFLPNFKSTPTRTIPSTDELNSPSYWRRFFAKPYNMASFTELSYRWRNHISQGDSNPGRYYLQNWQSPYNAWAI